MIEPTPIRASASVVGFQDRIRPETRVQFASAGSREVRSAGGSADPYEAISDCTLGGKVSWGWRFAFYRSPGPAAKIASYRSRASQLGEKNSDESVTIDSTREAQLRSLGYIE